MILWLQHLILATELWCKRIHSNNNNKWFVPHFLLLKLMICMWDDECNIVISSHRMLPIFNVFFHAFCCAVIANTFKNMCVSRTETGFNNTQQDSSVVFRLTIHLLFSPILHFIFHFGYLIPPQKNSRTCIYASFYSYTQL